MKEQKALENELKKHLVMNVCRIRFIACFVIGLIKTGTVNLTGIATAFPGDTEKDSKYKKIQLFFRSYPLSMEMTALLIIALICPESDRWVIAIDRTNWKFGKKNINILTLALVYENVAVPLIFVLLPKKGNSNTRERIDLVEKLLEVFPPEKIECLTADREFIGGKWFMYLTGKKIPFVIRIKENHLVSNSKGWFVPIKTLVRDVKPGQMKILKNRYILGLQLNIAATLSSEGEPVITVTNTDPEEALGYYKRRWSIETMFGCFKKKGFNFEDTHLTAPERIEKLFALLTLAFCWCLLVGDGLNSKKKIKIKKHRRKAKGLFRYGLDHLAETVYNTGIMFKRYRDLLRIFTKNLDKTQKFINKPKLSGG